MLSSAGNTQFSVNWLEAGTDFHRLLTACENAALNNAIPEGADLSASHYLLSGISADGVEK